MCLYPAPKQPTWEFHDLSNPLHQQSTFTPWDPSPFVFESLKNQEIPQSCSYKAYLTLFKILEKEYKNLLSDLEEMLQIKAPEGF